MFIHVKEYSLNILPRQSQIPNYRNQKLVTYSKVTLMLPSGTEEWRTWQASDRGIPMVTLRNLKRALIVPGPTSRNFDKSRLPNPAPVPPPRE